MKKIMKMEKPKFDIFEVGNGFRTNPLSKTPGGSTVIVEMKNGQKLSYNNIKNTEAYIKRVTKSDDVLRAYVK